MMTPAASATVAAIFTHEAAALEAFLAIQDRMGGARLEMGVAPAGNPFFSPRTLLAVRAPGDRAGELGELLRELGGEVMASGVSR
jgi:hypothetical protein